MISPSSISPVKIVDAKLREVIKKGLFVSIGSSTCVLSFNDNLNEIDRFGIDNIKKVLENFR